VNSMGRCWGESGDDGKWQMADGKWQMADGRWQMADGRWQMADGRWQMADGKAGVWACRGMRVWEDCIGARSTLRQRWPMAHGKWRPPIPPYPHTLTPSHPHTPQFPLSPEIHAAVTQSWHESCHGGCITRGNAMAKQYLTGILHPPLAPTPRSLPFPQVPPSTGCPSGQPLVRMPGGIRSRNLQVAHRARRARSGNLRMLTSRSFELAAQPEG